MTEIDTLIQETAEKRGVTLDRTQRAQVKLRLSYAGISDDAEARNVIGEVIKRIIPTPSPRTAGVMKTASASCCPRCQQPVSKVHLADNVPHGYCDGCRIVC